LLSHRLHPGFKVENVIFMFS